MNFIKKTVALGVLSSVFVMSCAWAVSASHKAAAYRLLDVMQINELMDQTVDQSIELQIRSNPGLRPFVGTIREFIQKYMSGEALKDDFAAAYADEFSEKELKELIKFYESPIGQKALRLSPELIAKVSAKGQLKMEDNMLDLKEKLSSEAERLEKDQDK